VAGGFLALSGNEVLTKEFGCEARGKRTHGLGLIRRMGNDVRVAVVPTKDDSLPKGTLSAILRELGIRKEELKKHL
jgi:hypothetical protein